MYIEMNPTGLTLSDLICVAHRKRREDTGFPYAVQSCRCYNCRYVGEGKGSLKEGCCMAERVRAHTCTFTEILNTCFANVKDNVFHYRLRLATLTVSLMSQSAMSRSGSSRCRISGMTGTTSSFMISFSPKRLTRCAPEVSLPLLRARGRWISRIRPSDGISPPARTSSEQSACRIRPLRHRRERKLSRILFFCRSATAW